MVGKSEVWKIVESGKLSLESDGRESSSREKDVAPLLHCPLTRQSSAASNIKRMNFQKKVIFGNTENRTQGQLGEKHERYLCAMPPILSLSLQ